MTGSDTEPRQTPDQVRDEINREQRLLAETLDALTDRVRPSSVARRQMDRVRRRGSRMADGARALVGRGPEHDEVLHAEVGEGLLLRSDEELVAAYEESERRLPPEALILIAGVGAVVAVGVVAWALRRRQGL
ncbi:DUF3618 domain-containing protein [Nocardiopsis sp. CNT312]|uniref:DUF3618 domain-containing protein n=1 Tax=Nocardiopsis sp. CNT312 TaxID=1137268 RepID=UPI00048B212D|nr:DUF3618 domain-containing protein [Nocardiopsis sp. CNT312]